MLLVFFTCGGPVGTYVSGSVCGPIRESVRHSVRDPVGGLVRGSFRGSGSSNVSLDSTTRGGVFPSGWSPLARSVLLILNGQSCGCARRSRPEGGRGAGCD